MREIASVGTINRGLRIKGSGIVSKDAPALGRYSTATDTNDREPHWSDAVAIGNEDFIETIRNQLGYKANGRRCRRPGSGYQLKEPRGKYALDFKLKKGD